MSAAHEATAAAGEERRAARRAALATRRLARRLGAAGAEHPDLGAAVLVARGRRLLDQRAFAALLGVPVAHLRSWESGRRPPSHVPRRLRRLDPDLDWSAAGVTAPGDPADPASRHPSAGRRSPLDPSPDRA